MPELKAQNRFLGFTVLAYSFTVIAYCSQTKTLSQNQPLPPPNLPSLQQIKPKDPSTPPWGEVIFPHPQGGWLEYLTDLNYQKPQQVLNYNPLGRLTLCQGQLNRGPHTITCLIKKIEPKHPNYFNRRKHLIRTQQNQRYLNYSPFRY